MPGTAPADPISRLRDDLRTGPFAKKGGWVHAVPPQQVAGIRHLLHEHAEQKATLAAILDTLDADLSPEAQIHRLRTGLAGFREPIPQTTTTHS